MTAENEILRRLDIIKSELDFIKEHLIDIDTIMTKEEEETFEESLQELKEGKTTSLEDFEKEMKNA